MKKKMIIPTIIIGLLLTTSIASVSANINLLSIKEVKSIKSLDGDADIFVDDDKYIDGLRRLAQAIKKSGVKTVLNLNHGGKQSAKALVKRGITPVAPSAIPIPDGTIPKERAVAGPPVVPRELHIEEILEIEDKFAEGALRARKAGFDLISLHGAHSYLINQFLSPAHNQREDDYGRDITGRSKFLL